MVRSSVQGASSLRRTLRRLPESSREELASALRDIGQKLLNRAKAVVPVRSGKLRNALAYKVAPKTLTLTLGLITKATQRDFFYGYILDAGRKGQTVKIRRGPRAGASMRIRAIGRNRYNFVFGRRKDFVDEEVPRLRQALDRALTDAINEGGND